MSKQRILRTIATTCAGLILTIGMAGPVGAQGGGSGAGSQTPQASAAPQPDLSGKKYPAWLGYIVIFLMIGAIIPLSLMPSKRSHQD